MNTVKTSIMKLHWTVHLLLSCLISICVTETIPEKVQLTLHMDNKSDNGMSSERFFKKITIPKNDITLNDFGVEMNVNDHIPLLSDNYNSVHKIEHDSQGDNKKDNGESDFKTRLDESKYRRRRSYEKDNGKHYYYADEQKNIIEHDHESHPIKMKSRHRRLIDKSSEENLSEEKTAKRIDDHESGHEIKTESDGATRHRRTSDNTSSEETEHKTCGCASKLQNPEHKIEEHLTDGKAQARHRRSNDNDCGCTFKIVKPEVKQETQTKDVKLRRRRTIDSFERSNFLEEDTNELEFNMEPYKKLSEQNVEMSSENRRDQFNNNYLTEANFNNIMPLHDQSIGITIKEEQLFNMKNKFDKYASPTGDLSHKLDLSKSILEKDSTKIYKLLNNDALFAYILSRHQNIDSTQKSTHKTINHKNFSNDYVQGCEGFE